MNQKIGENYFAGLASDGATVPPARQLTANLARFEAVFNQTLQAVI